MNKHKKSRAIKPKANSLRIIGGQWRGRKLTFADAPGLRPTADRVRETLFNWLQAKVVGSACLDLFSGSGALGLEALSRGAAHVTFLEKSPAVAKVLDQQLILLQANPKADVMQIDAVQYLETTHALTFDIVFIDPPFAHNLWQICCDKLKSGQCLNPNALIYVEQDKRSPALDLPQNWEVIKHKAAGNVRFQLIQIN